MPLGIKFLLILLLSGSWVATGICIGYAVKDSFSLALMVPAAVIAFITYLFLLKDYKTKKKDKTAKWYVDKFIVGLLPVFVIAAITIIVIGYDEDETLMYLGFLMFPVMSILIAPNAALYAIKDMKDWKRILYGNGNLESFKDNKDFYWVKAPVSFEKRIYLAVIKEQILNIFTVITFMVIVSVVGLISILTYDSHSVSPGDIFGAIFYVRVRRGAGVMAFILLLIVVFGFPLFVYYITNAIYKLRIVAGHKYMAYHAVVRYVHTYRVRIDSDKRHYEYKFGTLVGMRESKVDNTPAILIFIPDDVLIFPDEVVKPKEK